MKKNLTRTTNTLVGWHDGLWGNCTDLRGNCTDLRGDCTDLRGDCTGLRGDLDDCGITPEERKAGINIADLVGEE